MAEEGLIKHEIPYNKLTDPKWFGSFMPNVFLREWGFDTNKEITYWYDNFNGVMVLAQRRGSEPVVPPAPPSILDREYPVPMSIFIVFGCLLVRDLLYGFDWAQPLRGLLILIVFGFVIRMFVIDFRLMWRKRGQRGRNQGR